MADGAAKPRTRVVAAVVWDGAKLLMTQRPPGGPIGLQWEFPGGKIEPGETPQVALVREVREELGVGAVAHETIAVHAHDYPHGARVEVTFIRCTLSGYAFACSEAVHAHRWTEPAEIDLRDVLAGDRAFLAGLGAPAHEE